LIGKIIYRKLPSGVVLRARIVETEAYKGPEDKACHAYNNKRTERTKAFFLDAGHAYTYTIYGNNCCFNITAAEIDVPEATLIRSVEPMEGID
jgi:DNA-3-methyladenine glycosylase